MPQHGKNQRSYRQAGDEKIFEALISQIKRLSRQQFIFNLSVHPHLLPTLKSNN
jgi:hypothetical protein